MSQNDKRLYGLNSYLSLGFLFIATCFYTYYSSVSVYNVTLTGSDGASKNIALPFLENSGPVQDYVYKGIFKHNFLKQTTIRIIPDDCVKSVLVNGKSADLGGIDGKALCDYRQGFALDIGRLLVSGENSIELTINDGGGKFGLFITNSFHDSRYFISISLLIFLSFALLAKTLRNRNFGHVTILILFGGLLIRIVYLSYTPFEVRAHDVIGHIQYMDFILENDVLPAKDWCWQCYHPPLYYLLSVAFLKAVYFIGGVDKYLSLQILSLIMSFLLTIYASLIFRKVTKSPVYYNLMLGLTVFWPSMVLHSIRIGNDSLLYLFYIAGLYHLYSWSSDRKWTQLVLSALFISLALASKTNGVVLLGVFLATIAWRVLKDDNKSKIIKQSLIAFVVLLLGFSSVYYNSFIRTKNDKQADWLVGNSHQLPQRIMVGNKIGNYLKFDVKNFVSEPYTDPWNDGKGRQYFWSYLLKTSLFGEWSFDQKINRQAAHIMSFLLLCMTAFFLWRLVPAIKKDLDANIVFVLNIALLVTALLFLRIKVPAAPSNDFRYILPAIISYNVFFVGAIERLGEKRRHILKYAGYLTGLVFIFTSIVFIVNPLFGS